MKKGTIFCDIDGTLVTHDDLVGSHTQAWLCGAKDKLIEWNSQYTVVFTTSRIDLTSFKLFLVSEGFTLADFLWLSGLPLGCRFLINDTKRGENKAIAVQVNRNQGLTDVILE